MIISSTKRRCFCPKLSTCRCGMSIIFNKQFSKITSSYQVANLSVNSLCTFPSENRDATHINAGALTGSWRDERKKRRDLFREFDFAGRKFICVTRMERTWHIEQKTRGIAHGAYVRSLVADRLYNEIGAGAIKPSTAQRERCRHLKPFTCTVLSDIISWSWLAVVSSKRDGASRAMASLNDANCLDGAAFSCDSG